MCLKPFSLLFTLIGFILLTPKTIFAADPDKALNFDGFNDYAVGDFNGVTSDTVTIEMWVLFNSLTNQQNLLNINQVGTQCRIVPYKDPSNTNSCFKH